MVCQAELVREPGSAPSNTEVPAGTPDSSSLLTLANH